MFKQLILICLVALTLSSCGIVNQVRLRTENLDLEANWPTQLTESAIRTHYIGEKPFVVMRVNEQTDLLFMVDTGATVTLLFDTEKTKALKLQRGYGLKMRGWGDESDSQAFKSKLAHVQLGDAHFTDVTVGYIPISKSQYFIDEKQAIFDGVIGWDLMHHFSWTFDKRHNQITISNQAAQVSENATVVPFESFFTKLYVDASVKYNDSTELPGEFIIDTGSRHYVKLKQEFVDSRDILIDSAKVTAADFGLSGKAEHYRVSVPQFSLGDHVFKNVKTNLIRGGDEDEHWVIGSALLNQFISIVDYHTSTLHLIPFADAEFQTRYNLLGLELRKLTTGDFVVQYVMPDMAAKNSKIERGDIVTQINGYSSNAISSDQWLSISAMPGEHEVCYQSGSDTICSAMTAKHIAGYSDKGS